MKIDHLTLGSYQTNCYILRKTKVATECLIVDTGLQANQPVDFLRQNNLNPAAVVLTHGHADHIAGVGAVCKSWPDIKVYIHKRDAEMLTGQRPNLSEMTGQPFSTKPADFLIEEPDVIEQAGIKLQVLHTPGHTPGGICLYSKQQGIVFVGDTLFAGSVGRTDLANGSMTQLIKSIKEKLCVLPDETIVYPGHGPSTTISQEKAHNPFLQ